MIKASINKISNPPRKYNCYVHLDMEQALPEQLENLCWPGEQLEMRNRLCGSETNHVDFMNHDTYLSTFDMVGLLAPVLFAGDNDTAAQPED